jgi:hypothetical protein
MRRQEFPNYGTGKNIIVIEDASLPKNHIRLECARSEVEFAQAIKAIMAGDMIVTVAPKKMPWKVIHFVVSPADYDNAVALMADDEVTPATDAEFASEIMRATRETN